MLTNVLATVLHSVPTLHYIHGLSSVPAIYDLGSKPLASILL